MKHAQLLALLLAVVVGACASTGDGERTRTDRNQLTAEEIQQRQFNSAYEAVQALRSPWLRERVEDGTAERIVVYVDGTRAGGTGFLRQVEASAVVSMRYLSPSEASTRYGSGHNGGVIQVHTRNR
jgi:hypothetical protein